MYKLKEQSKKTGKIISKINLVNVDGYVMQSKKKFFLIDGEKISDIKLIDNNLINTIVKEQVSKKYNKLIKELTELFICESDDTEGSMNEVLNRIEKFRQEIKYKYRSYLTKKELEKMSSQLKVLQKEAVKKLNEVLNYTYDNVISRNR